MSNRQFAGISILFLAAFFSLSSVPFALYGYPKTSNEFGDAFGFMNALMSSVAALGVVLAITLQTIELRESRESAKKSEQSQREMIEMQLFGSYLNGISTLVNHDDNVGASLPTDREQYLAMKSEDIKELELLLDRMKPLAHHFIKRQPFDYQGLLGPMQMTLSFVQAILPSDPVQAKQELAKLLIGLNSWMPAIHRSPLPLDRKIDEFVYSLRTLHNDIPPVGDRDEFVTNRVAPLTQDMLKIIEEYRKKVMSEFHREKSAL